MRTYVSKRFGIKLIDFRVWIELQDPKTEFNFSMTGQPLAQYITQTHKTLFASIGVRSYWIHGRNHVRKGYLPYWALAMNGKIAHQALITKKIKVPFTAGDVLAALEGL